MAGLPRGSVSCSKAGSKAGLVLAWCPGPQAGGIPACGHGSVPACGPQSLAGWPRASPQPLPRLPSGARRSPPPLPAQADVLTCVASTDPGFRAHWLVAALGSVGRFLKAVVSMLLPER